MAVDMGRVEALIEAVAAEEILPRFQALADHEVKEKAGGELVTVADELSEARLTPALKDILPGSEVIGEEAVAADPKVLRRVLSEGSYWLVDPVDGTNNFAHGRPCFAVMVALVSGGRTRAAWIHDPVGGVTAQAEEGGGAWLEGERLKAATAAPLTEMTGTLHAGQYGGPELVRRAERLRQEISTRKSLRCAGQEYVRLARGEMHFSLFTKLMPWDHAPGVLIYREAGGLARLLDGRPYEARITEGPALLLAPDEAGWEALRAKLAA